VDSVATQQPGFDRFGLMLHDWVMLIYLAATAVAAVFALDAIPKQAGTAIAWHAAAIVAILILARRYRGEDGWFRLLRYWYVCPLVPLLYAETGFLVPALNPVDLDLVLADLDVKLFGGSVLGWCESWSHPLLTDLLQLCYVSYFTLPYILGICIWKSGRLVEFRALIFAFLFAWLLSFAGYYFVPATGPFRLPLDVIGCTLPDLEGWFIRPWLGPIVREAPGVMRDCFPSGHTMIAIVCIWYGHKQNNPARWVVTPLASGLIVSTVYLRYHYAVDLVGSVLMVTPVILLTPILTARYEYTGDGQPATGHAQSETETEA
jgi:membrane-associated phospholipid phosphatase